MDIIRQVEDLLDGLEAEGRKPAVLLVGHREAAEIEAALYRPAEIIRGLRGEVLFDDPAYAPTLPYPMTECATLYGVPIRRVDQDTLLGVIAEGFDQAVGTTGGG